MQAKRLKDVLVPTAMMQIITHKLTVFMLAEPDCRYGRINCNEVSTEMSSLISSYIVPAITLGHSHQKNFNSGILHSFQATNFKFNFSREPNNQRVVDIEFNTNMEILTTKTVSNYVYRLKLIEAPIMDMQVTHV